ncbi:MAG: hypothetical protein KatS3mg018_0564 [Fimbriimonadales bacterium]|jgi:hypothetical protein|nr:MAG: hypothetical protein KatS3mg018_0564 [Fimbriimonadales bacterium]
MPKSKTALRDLANPVREFVCRGGRNIPYKPLTLRQLAELETRHGSIDALMGRIAAGEVGAMLALIESAVRGAGFEGDVGEMFVLGDLQEGGDAYNLLMEILGASGFVVDTGQKK